MTTKASNARSREVLRKRRVLIVAPPGSQILDVVGPFQIFVRAAELLARNGHAPADNYSVEVITTSRGNGIKTNCGLTLYGNRNFRSVRGHVDTMLVAGGSETENPPENERLFRWLGKMASEARRFGSICTGTLLLAEAGLLNGKRVTTHWKWCAELARRCPQVTVEPDPIFVRDGNLYTSAGVTAGMDLALALVEEDFGSSLALEVARELVLYLRRPGGQSQFSAALSLQMTDRQPFRELEFWVLGRLAKDLSIPILAERVAMSPRNFARSFRREMGLTPARFVERLRVETARRRLEESRHYLKEIAAECGFGSADVMRRVFQRLLNTAPSKYRSHFKRNPSAIRAPDPVVKVQNLKSRRSY